MTHVLASEFARFTAEAFVAGLWQGLVLVSAIALCLRVLFKASASVRFAIWAITFALVIAIPLLHRHGSNTAGVIISSAVLHASPAWAVAIASLWAALSIARFIQLLIQARRLRRVWKSATPVASAETELETLRSTRRRIELCISPDVDSPCVIGFFSSRLLIPDSLFTTLTESELRHVVLHECEHLRRYDDWVNLAQKIALAIFPLNPALLFVDHRLSDERELACDAGVIARTRAPFDYARCLARLAEHRLISRRMSLALAAWTRKSELARRIHALVKPASSLSPLYTRASVAGLTIVLAAGAVELAHAPHLISFNRNQPLRVASGADMVYRPATLQPVPVVFNKSTQQPQATFLKATLPAAKPTNTKSAVKPQRRTKTAKPQQPHLLRTHASISGRPNRNSQVLPNFVTAEFTPSYAAVPFGDGWLIIQL